MKRLIVLCDGTWNTPEGFKTNVAKLDGQFPNPGPDGVAQITAYIPGVGTQEGPQGVEGLAERYGGAAFGWGLVNRIRMGFAFLVANYAVGDEIYLFGFSRGAYTARSLGGLIRSAGIPPRSQTHRIDEAMARYRNRDQDTHPRTEASVRFRWGLSPAVCTGDNDETWRRAQGHPVGHRLRITYMGIWDTVGALGVPTAFGALAGLINARHVFHDAELSSMVHAGRHAMATDERRRFYPVSYWKNIDQLNQGRDGQPFRQEWFPGDHGMVGGSGANRELSEFALDWILDGAADQGLQVDPSFRAAVRQARAFGGPLSNRRRRFSALGRSRRVSEHSRDVAEVTLHRLAFGDRDGGVYDPPTLQPLRRVFEDRMPGAPDPNFPKDAE